MSDPAQTVTLSDGSVWQYGGQSEFGATWLPIKGKGEQLTHACFGVPRAVLTAADHRAIADVLDPPASLLPSPSEREEPYSGAAILPVWREAERVDLAKIIREGERHAASAEGVAHAILLEGYSKRSSPSSSEPDVSKATTEGDELYAKLDAYRVRHRFIGDEAVHQTWQDAVQAIGRGVNGNPNYDAELIDVALHAFGDAMIDAYKSSPSSEGVTR